jgi:hypothetical protein
MPNCRFTSCAVVVALCLACCVAASAEGLSALDEALLADARDGSLDRFDLPSACLVAGGVTDERDLAENRRRLRDACTGIVGAIPAPAPASERARHLFQAMHDQLLVGKYHRGASNLRRTLASGDYNCLSALVVYHELCSQAGVPLSLGAQPGHVFCQFGNMRIEPTCRQGNPPALEGPPPREITPVQLAGRFYYNRGIELLQQRQFEGGVAALQAACILDPHDADARANLLAGLNNWALAISSDSEHAAAALVARGLAIEPDFPPLVASESYLRQRIGRRQAVRP